MRGFKSEKLNGSDNQCIVLLKSLAPVNIYFEKLCGKCRFFKPKRTIACYRNYLFAPNPKGALLLPQFPFGVRGEIF